LPVPPVTPIVTVKSRAVLMLDKDGVTVTVGVRWMDAFVRQTAGA